MHTMRSQTRPSAPDPQTRAEKHNSWANLDEVSAPEPVSEDDGNQSNEKVQESKPSGDTDMEFGNLDELADPAPDQNPEESTTYRHSNLEDERPSDEDTTSQPSHTESSGNTGEEYLNRLVVVSNLIFYSIFGTLARLGLQALTKYPGAPVSNTELWANVGGSFVMGFMSEDRLIFRRHWNTLREEAQTKNEDEKSRDEESQGDEAGAETDDAAQTVAAFASTKAAIPAYIGITVGFCGSFTSFSSFIRDAFLALSNNLDTALVSTVITTDVARTRSGGHSVMAVLAVFIMESSLSLAALFFGAHTATFFHPFALASSGFNLGRYYDVLIIPIAWGTWIGAIVMTILPPDGSNDLTETWRGQVLFALVFAPLGCLLRFQLSLWLNGRIRSFPLGTFAANTFGTLILGLCYDLQRSKLGAAGGLIGGGIVGCQALQGIQDGFCGCLTTVSTWALELKGLRRSHAYIYGIVSVGVSFSILVIIMGTLSWTHGFATPACKV